MKRSSRATAKARRPTQALKSRRSKLTLLTETGAGKMATQAIICPIGIFEIQLATSRRRNKHLIAPAASRRLSRIYPSVGDHTKIAEILQALQSSTALQRGTPLPHATIMHKSGMLHPNFQELQFRSIKNGHKQFAIIGEEVDGDSGLSGTSGTSTEATAPSRTTSSYWPTSTSWYETSS